MPATCGLAASSTAAPVQPEVLDHIAQGVGPELGVERHRHYSRPHRAEHDLDELDAVADRYGETVAALEPKARQRRRDAVEAPLKFGVGRLARRIPREVDERDLAGEACRRAAAPVAEISCSGIGGSHDRILVSLVGGLSVTAG